VRDAFLGVRRFDDFQARLGISRNILDHRLRHLTDHGILERVPYQDNPPRSEYRLTAKGSDLWPVVTAMRQWGDMWSAGNGPPLRIRHKSCGRLTQALEVCSQCGEPLDARRRLRPNPSRLDPPFPTTRPEKQHEHAMCPACRACTIRQGSRSAA
jgi:DNA-binding HxlR family transcriptional regulator